MGTPGQVEVYSQTADRTNARLWDFDIARHELKPAHVQWLQQYIVGLLRAGGSLWITGTASPSDTESFNLALSRRRADEVIRFLRQQSPNNFNVAVDLAVGESYARSQGVPDGKEDPNWRAVIISAWMKPTPPPPPRRPPPPKPVSMVVRKKSVSFPWDYSQKDPSLDSKFGNEALKYARQKAMRAMPLRFQDHQIPASHELIRIYTARRDGSFNSGVTKSTLVYCHVFYQWGVRRRACHLINGYFLGGAFKRNWPDLYELADTHEKQWLDDPRIGLDQLHKLVQRSISLQAYYLQGNSLGEPAPPPGFGW